MVAATQDFFEPTANPPYNRQYRNQGWQDNQPIRGNPSRQQQDQQRQPYTYSQPQNNQNVRYQPPHNRQQPYPSNNPPLSIEEAMRIYQKENQEIKEIQRRIAEQISKLYEMMQDTTSPLAQVPPPAANTLPAQPSQNLKSAQLADSDDQGNEVEFEGEYSDESGKDGVGREDEDEEDFDEDNGEESEDEEENEDWLYDLLVELYEAQKREKESGDSQSEEESDIDDEIEEVETDDQHDKPFFIATLFNNKRVKEEIPAKCEYPGPCLVTCKIKHAILRECLCDPGACSSVMPYELYKFLGLGPLKKTKDLYQRRHQRCVSGGDHRRRGFNLNYHEEIFTFEVGNKIEIFHFDDSPEPEKKGLHQLKIDKKKKKKKRIAKKRRKREEEEADKKNWQLKIQAAKSKKDKKKKALSTLEKRKGIRKIEGSNPKKKRGWKGKRLEETERRRRKIKLKRKRMKHESDAQASTNCSENLRD
ncbi:hypothetical protein PIB30_009220 [Stylosanthes scabra]|uniref:Uncharacterized protein n=1 Tax=Stylosanthes scabra TaxID=79078 RepID=A0ABU6Q547_9FABA|nr:hypothetical protein [Stylosanthes scabra]